MIALICPILSAKYYVRFRTFIMELINATRS